MARRTHRLAAVLALASCSDTGSATTSETGLTILPSTTGETPSTTEDPPGESGETGSTGGETPTSGETTADPSSSTTGDDGGDVVPVVPTDSGTGVVFEGGGHRLVISANGGRIVEYSLSGTNVLSTAGEFVQQGSTFWVAPQSWGWPPPAAHDSAAFTYAIEGNEAVFTGGTNGVDVSITKRASMTDDGAVSLTYTLTAVSAAVSWAPWEVSRLAPTLCFFGTGSDQGTFDYGSTSPITPQVQGAVTWVPFEQGNTAQRTLLADAAGWSGCATGPSGLLFLKRFADIPSSAFSEGNGELKIWWEGNAFLELEQMGPFGTVAPGAPVTYTVEWTLEQLPADVVVEAGSPSLEALLPQGG